MLQVAVTTIGILWLYLLEYCRIGLKLWLFSPSAWTLPWLLEIGLNTTHCCSIHARTWVGLAFTLLGACELRRDPLSRSHLSAYDIISHTSG